MEAGNTFIYQNILTDMSEGVLVVNLKGKITMLNPAASELLGLSPDVVGKSFVSVFFESNISNDEFTQMIVNAIYEKDVKHNIVLTYNLEEEKKQYFVSTSFLKDGDRKIGIVAVIKDITEMMELRDAVKAMEQIRSLNKQLKKRNQFIKKTFGRYLSDEIVEEILESEDGLKMGGQKKNVTILFSDLRGFTNISEQMEATALLTMLNHYLECMIPIITEHYGTILEFIGDAIVVVFGAPKPRKDMEKMAVVCALHMQNEMKQVNAWNEERGYPPLQMGIGIHTGEAILGNIGSSLKTKYDMIGKNVNLASRIESCTVGHQILISKTTCEALKDQIQIRGSQSVTLKGLQKPIELYDVCGLGTVRLECETEQMIPVKPVMAYLQSIEGKTISDTLSEVCVCAVSAHEMIVEADRLPSVGKNVVVHLTENDKEQRIAKVVEKSDGKIRLHFTAGNPECATFVATDRIE